VSGCYQRRPALSVATTAVAAATFGHHDAVFSFHLDMSVLLSALAGRIVPRCGVLRPLGAVA
jgi:hypothetical protein